MTTPKKPTRAEAKPERSQRLCRHCRDHYLDLGESCYVHAHANLEGKP